jgi:hypothetical protein
MASGLQVQDRMIPKVTDRTESLVVELAALAERVDDHLLSAASPHAREEWDALRRRWPSTADVAAGAVTVSDDELDVMIGKVRRFRSILEGLRRHGLGALGAMPLVQTLLEAA